MFFFSVCSLFQLMLASQGGGVVFAAGFFRRGAGFVFPAEGITRCAVVELSEFG